jgi:hypothetical protein
MSKFPSFLEYMNDKGAVVDKPDTETVPDYHGPEEKTPPNSKVPYKTPVANKAPEKGESGLAELGDKALKYEPKVDAKPEVKKEVMKEYVDENGKITKVKVDINAKYNGKIPESPPDKGAKPYIGSAIKPGDKALGELGHKELEYNPDTQTAAKVKKTEGFVNKTKGMSLAEFTKYMLDECGCGQVDDETMPFITAYTTGKFQPHPPEVIRYVTALADKNEGILNNLVSTMVSMGYLNKLLKAIFEHPEAYEELTNLLNDDQDGPSRCDSLVGSMSNSYNKFVSDQEGMYEAVGFPYGFDMDDMERGEDKEGEEGSDEDESEFDDEGSEDDSEFDDEDSDDDSEFDDEESDDDSEFDDEEDHDSKDFEDDLSGETEPQAAPEKKLKKKFAHHHLLDAMRKHGHMMSAMKSEGIDREAQLKRMLTKVKRDPEMDKFFYLTPGTCPLCKKRKKSGEPCKNPECKETYDRIK